MSKTNDVPKHREVPTYEVEEGDAWFHFLHGNVPGHQIDYIVRPEIPQRELTRQHFSHLSRIVKYIEPRRGSDYAFAIANLSRDDTQYEPGHGGIALIFGLRIKGARDHAGRQDPPFCHAIAAVDRHLDAEMLRKTAMEFYQKLLSDKDSHAEGSGWYHSYVQHAQHANALKPLLKSYLADFKLLPVPGTSQLSLRFTVEGSLPPRRVVIVVPEETQFDALAHCMANIANVLEESDIKWTAISNGREADVVGGLTVRFVARPDAAAEPSDVVVMELEQVPENARDIARQLFNAREVRISIQPQARAHRRPLEAQDAAVQGATGMDVLPPHIDLAAELKRKQRKQPMMTLIGFAALILAFGILAVVWVGSTPKPVEDVQPANSASAPKAIVSQAPSSAPEPSQQNGLSNVQVKPSATPTKPRTTVRPRQTTTKVPFGGTL